MSNNPKPSSTPTTDLKVRQLQQYLHRPGWIATAAHPFVKQMAQSQPTPPRSGYPLRNLIKTMLAGFRVMSSLGVPFLVQPLALLLGRPIGPPCRAYPAYSLQPVQKAVGSQDPQKPLRKTSPQRQTLTTANNTMVTKSDFVLAPYMQSSDRLAIYQIFTTVVPYIGLWVLAVKAASISLWLLPPIVGLMVLFLLRCFSLMHDCGHYSLFRSRRANRVAGTVLGVINAIPPYAWSRDHAYHHKTNGDWQRYRGIGDFLSTEEFAQLSAFGQKLYSLLRQPIITLPGGFFYLVIQPRLTLMSGICEFIGHGVTCLRRNGLKNFGSIVSSHKSKHWQTSVEFWDVLLNNVLVVGSWLILSHLIGPGLFWGLYSTVMTLAGAIFICVFFVQHNFEGSYAHKTADWNYLRGAIEGTSYLDLPSILRWFTADISYHTIHHLSERIPNYNLAACHRANHHLLSKMTSLQLGDLLHCSKFILWDADANQLVPIPTQKKGSLLTVLTKFYSVKK
jgi:omega-6 fatty acid desaturase (delta-12 desaturase)